MRFQAMLVCGLLMVGPFGAGAQEDPCSYEGTFQEFLDERTSSISDRVNAAAGQAKEDWEAQAEPALATRANSDGVTGGRLDLLRRAFVALDLGDVTDEEGKLVFNFNPDALKLPVLGQLSPRVVVHEAALYPALDEAIDELAEDTRQGRKDALAKGLGDLDDVELRLRWTNASQTPGQDIEDLARQIFDQGYAERAQAIMREIAEKAAEAQGAIGSRLERGRRLAEDASVGDEAVASICDTEGAKETFLGLVELLDAKGEEGLRALKADLEERDYFALADLAEGEPRFTAEGALRRRDGAAGPDEYSLDLRFEMGPVSMRGFKKWAAAKALPTDVEAAHEYLAAMGLLQKHLPKFSFTAQYTDVADFSLPIPEEAEPFTLDGSHKLSGTLQGGWYFGGGRDRRLELAASYEDFSDDPARQDRLVGTLSWIETLGESLAQVVGGSEFAVSLVYASKPEFRGEVDEELGLRAGLKWSLGKKAAAPESKGESR